MSTRQEQTAADPYAELKAASKAGRRIRVKDTRGKWCRWMLGTNWAWTSPVDHYEIEPLPTYHTPEVVKERREQAEAINTAMNPTPAGKMSDKELAEIYQNTTAASHVGHSVYKWDELSQDHQEARIQGIRAVREQVEKEQAEEIARLTAELEEKNRRFSTLQETMVSYRDESRSLAAQLAAVTAELERMQWRPVSVKPTRGDADEGGFVTVLRADKLTAIVQWDASCFNPDFDWRQISQALRYTKWRAAALPPSPSAEKVERKRFEKWYQDYKAIKSPKGLAFDAWQAACASKETNPASAK